MSGHRPLPGFALLRCFESAAKYESFSAAAEDLGISQGVVSRHVRDLEVYVGLSLFRREGRGVKLTHAGEALAREMSHDLERLRRTFAQAIAAGEKRRSLRIAAPPTFSSRWLVPRLKLFRALHPDIEFMLESCSEPFNLADSRVDVAIHFGGWEWPEARLSPLCLENLVVVAAPELAAMVRGDSLRNLCRLPLLHLSSRPQLWDIFFSSIDQQPQTRHQGSYFDQFSLVIAAALAGMGAAIIPTYLIEDELSESRLKCLATLPGDKSRMYFVVTRMQPHDKLTHFFTGWLHQQVSNTPTSEQRLEVNRGVHLI